MSRASKLVLVPTVQAYPEYASWYKVRGLEGRCPAPPNLGIFVAHVKYGLVLGSCVYNTDGPYLLLEHSAVNPENLRLWRPAGLFMLQEFRRMATMMNKWPHVFPERKSIAKICKEAGFVPTGAITMVAPMVNG